MRAALVLIALVGCYDDAPGMRVVVRDPNHRATKVELFLSNRTADRDRLGPDQARASERRDKLRGDVYFLDGPSDGTTPMTVRDVVDGEVVWNVKADPDGPRHLKLVVAVAYDEQDQVVGVAKMSDLEVPVNDAIAYVLTLEDATQIPPSDLRQPPGWRVWPWRKATAPTTAACLGLEISDGESNVDRIWIVPEDDPDCDEVQLECDPYLYHADFSEAATPCVLPAVVTGTNHVPCKLGTKVCEDGVSAGSCVPLTGPTYCAAAALCDPDTCFQDPAQCAEVDSSSVECVLAVETNGALCDAPAIGSGPLPVALSAGGALFPGGCQAVGFATPDVNAGTGFVTSNMATIGTSTFTIDGLSTAACSFSIAVGGQFDATTAANGLVLLVLDVTSGSVHFIIPVFITLQPNLCAQRAPACNSSRGSNTDLGVCT